MIKHLYICDKCRKQMEENEAVTIKQSGNFDTWIMLKTNEICKDCFQEFRVWIGLTPDEIVIPDALKKYAENTEDAESEVVENGRTEGI